MCTRSEIPKKKHHLSEIYDLYWDEYIQSKERQLYLEPKHFEAVNKARACGSEKLGIAIFCCIGCGDTTYVTRSCKHRFCGKCSNADTNRWAIKTLTRLLNIKHHHIITTLPKPLRKLSKKNDNTLYDLLFRVSAEVIKSWFITKHGILPGIVSVLHTGGSDLKYHPHVHMVVTGGGYQVKDKKYISLKEDFLCRQKFIGRQLKINYIMALTKLNKKGLLKVPQRIADPRSFKNWLFQINQKHWIVSIQKPLEDVQQIVGYVGRYTKRACLSEYKILSISPRIEFKYNDYKNSKAGQKPKQSVKSLKPIEFLDQLLQHVPDKRYRMVRYFGLYNSRYLSKIPQDQKINKDELEQAIEIEEMNLGDFELYRKAFLKAGLEDPLFCKACQQDKVLYAIKYKDKFVEVFKYDSS